MGDELIPEVAVWPVRARTPLTPEVVLDGAEVEPGDVQADRALALHELVRERARLRARELDLLTAFFIADPDVAGCLDDADISAMKVAVGLRCSTHRAEGMIRDAHRAVDLMPRTHQALGAGDLPEDWHDVLLRHVRPLTEDQVRAVDQHVSSWDLASISRSRFDRHLRHLIALVTAGTPPTPPSAQRRVELEVSDPTCGTATLSITGPVPEIHALAHRLDVSARAVQQAQRAVLVEDDEGEIPFDLDGTVRQRGRALSLSALRYAILTRTVLDTDPVMDPTQPYKILVTVPVLTLLGLSEAPASLDGLVPVPADQARRLAAEQSTWYRILTDATTGSHLESSPTIYRPTAQMRDQLRLRHPVCAAPGCHRATSLAAEDDHIEEFDHADPARGGPTSLLNLHRLCWRHHQLKTAGRIDPQRGDITDPTGPPPATTWDLDEDLRTSTEADRDLVTPLLAGALAAAWRVHLRTQDDALRLRDAARSTPRLERITAERRAEQLRFRGGARRPQSARPAGADRPAQPPPF